MRNRILIVLFVQSIAYVGALWAQSSDAYLRALEGEAGNLSVDENTRAQGDSSTLSSGDNAGNNSGAIPDGFAAGLSFQQFEQMLERNYIGSFLFYKRLSGGQKESVYATYQRSPDPGAVREQILNLSKQQEQ